jgi:hypothetical protein
MTTTDTVTTPVSLAALWRQWQKIDALPEHDDKIHAALNAIEKEIIDRPADNPADLKAKLKFLANLASDHDWNGRIEKLYQSIETGLEKSLDTGWQIICDFDDPMRLIENMSQALSIFTLAEDVWNDERDAVCAQALLFNIKDSCKKLRDLYSEIADLLRPRSERLKPEIVELMAERERIVSETNASPLAGSMTREGEEAFAALVEVASKRIAEIDEQIADMVTTNADGLAAQVELLDVLGGDGFGQGISSDHSDNCSVRLSASIQRGIRQLHDRAAT